MDRSSANGGLFRTSFLEKGLVTFAECLTHYTSFGADDLLGEMRLLLTPPMLAVPFGVSSARYYALMDALIQCAGNNRDLGDAQRAKLVGICTDICVFLRDRTPNTRREGFETALATAFETVRTCSIHPEIVEPILKALKQEADDVSPVPPQTEDLQVLDFAEPPAGFHTVAA